MYATLSVMVEKIVMKLVYALRGIAYALVHDRSFQLHVFFIGPTIAVCAYILSPLSLTELLFLGLAWALTLITEIQNSALEEALDHLHPDLHDSIKKSKDMTAGATLLAGFFLVFVLILVAIY